MTNFVQIQSGNFRALVRLKNLAKVEDKLAKVKPPVMDYGKITQRDRARIFPVYKPGMSMAEYVRRYEIANGARSMPDIWQGLNDKPADHYDPSVPLCVEDANPDYVPGIDDAPLKTKRTRKAAKPMLDKIDELALSLSLLSDRDMNRLALTLWMRYPRTCKNLTDKIFFAENLLTAPTDQGGAT